MSMNTPDFPITPDTFVFFDDVLLIDFVNTEIVKRRKRYDLIATPEHLSMWRGAAHAHYPHMISQDEVCDDATVALVRDYRQTWRTILEEIVKGHPVSAAALTHVNLVLQNTHLELVQDADLGFHQIHHGFPELFHDWLLPITQSGMNLLLERDMGRLRHCRNEHCILFFYDHSKNGTREWCSSACMNRARSSAKYHASKPDASV